MFKSNKVREKKYQNVSRTPSIQFRSHSFPSESSTCGIRIATDFSSHPDPILIRNSTQPQPVLVDTVMLDYERELGTGSYGRVYKAIWGSKVVAVKKLHDRTRQEIAEWMQLLNARKQLSHHRVIRVRSHQCHYCNCCVCICIYMNSCILTD